MTPTFSKPVIEKDFFLTANDLYLFNEGTHYQIYEKWGAHPAQKNGVDGVNFAVWAPNARKVSVMGNFNGWQRNTHNLISRGQSGVWEGFFPGIKKGDTYKYFIESNHHGQKVEKADPCAFCSEIPPRTASIVWDWDYSWQDQKWMGQDRPQKNSLLSPISIYEVHLGSWKRVPEEGNRFLTYREIAPQLAEYVKKMGFTHVELMPVMEHPYYPSWGYQANGYFSPTSRYGTPQDFMFLVDTLHQNGIGVILDWVPSHFPRDEYSLGNFDGTHLYDHADPRKGKHPDWGSLIFNYGRHEVRSFLISNALFWLKVYHIDGLRVDGVASMLYLDYSRQNLDWVPNRFGGKENLEAIDLIKAFNEAVYKNAPGTQTIAEESTAWPLVSRPTYVGGLGFGFKWDMGWMHDTLRYFSRDPVHRKFHHQELTFRMLYAFHENFILSLSHDEVVHGKGSLLGKMPGDYWQKFANLRLLYGYMFGTLGKKHIFMGGEIGQWGEWNHDESIEWHLLNFPIHQGLQKFLADLNKTYKAEPALYEIDFDPSGFEWIDCNDAQQSVISFIRRGKSNGDVILCICNFTPVPRENYRVGVPKSGFWKELINSDAVEYGGSGQGNFGGQEASAAGFHGRPFSLNLTLPPLAALFFKA